MYDLEVLRELNRRAVMSARKMVNGELETDEWDEDRSEGITLADLKPVFPLAILASKLTVGPPSVVRLIDLLEASESVAEFLELVREFLPEFETLIMDQMEDTGRIARFAEHFSEKYFPLDGEYGQYDDFTLADFTHHIPVELFGFTYDDYEEFDSYRNGFILLLSLVESPSYGDEGERVVILERVKELVGAWALGVIPPDGWSLDDLHTMLDDTKYEGAVAFVDWVHANTGCWQLDANYMEYEGEDWSARVVHGLTEQRAEVIALQDKMGNMYVWLEEDMVHNFQELLAAMLGVDVKDMDYQPVAKEQLPLAIGE